MGAPPLKRRSLGHPCATLSCAVLPISTPSCHAHSRAQCRQACPSNRKAIAPGFIPWTTPSQMPIPSQRHRVMLIRVRNATVHAHPVERLSLQALSSGQRHRTCPSRRNAIASCPLACATPSCMPISPQCQCIMPTRVRNVIVHAHPLATSSRHAQWWVQRDPVSKRVAQQPHVADAARGERDRSYFEMQIRLNSHLDLSGRRS